MSVAGAIGANDAEDQIARLEASGMSKEDRQAVGRAMVRMHLSALSAVADLEAHSASKDEYKLASRLFLTFLTENVKTMTLLNTKGEPS